MTVELEFVSEMDLLRELLRRFDHGVFIGVRPPMKADTKTDPVTICEWGSREQMAFHCQTFSDAVNVLHRRQVEEILSADVEDE